MKKTNEFPQVHIHPHSVMLILCAARAHRSFLNLQIKSPLTFHDAPDFLHCYHPTTRKLTEGRYCPVSHRTANTVSLAIDAYHDRPDGIVVPRTRTSLSLRASNFHRVTYSRSCAFFFGGPCRCRCRGWECGYPTGTRKLVFVSWRDRRSRLSTPFLKSRERQVRCLTIGSP